MVERQMSHSRGEFLSALRSLLVGSQIVEKGAVDSQKSWNADSFLPTRDSEPSHRKGLLGSNISWCQLDT